jgi:beta-galactosidase
LTLTEQELKEAGAQLCFPGCDDEGWYFVNNQFIGESHDWQAQPVFDIKPFVHAGDNVIAVGVNNGPGQGGLNPNVSAKIIGHAGVPPWSRSLFNGLAQIIVQSTGQTGEFKLTASTDGLTPAVVSVQTQRCAPRQSVP